MKLRLLWTGCCVQLAACAASTGGMGGGGPLDAHGDSTSALLDTAPADAAKRDAIKADGTQQDVTKAPGTVGAACTADGDCTAFPGLTCFTKIDPVPAVGFPGMTWPGGYCSKACSDTDSDCGAEGSCSQSGSGGGQTSYKMQYCAKGCKSDEACRVADGYKCQIVLMGYGICVPSAP